MTASSISSALLDRLTEELFQVRHHALLRAVLNNISEGIFIADATGKLLYFNAFAQKVGGLPEDGASPSQWSQHYGLFYPDGQTPFPAENLPLVRALHGEDSRDVDLVVRNPHVPEGLHIRASGVPIRDERGNLLGAMALVQDLNNLHRMEAEKRRTEQHFRLLVETAREGIWTLDTEGRTTYVNRYMAELLGYAVDEMLGMHLFSFLDEASQQVERAQLASRGGAHRAEVRDTPFLRKDGTLVWTSISTTPILDEQGHYTGSLSMVTDITQRRAAEAHVRQLNAELERRIAERTEQLEFSNRELEAFAYSVAHDLRAPLRSISCFCGAMAEDCSASLDQTGLDYLRRIMGGAKRMGELIDGILALSRANQTALVTSECDLSAMARSIAEQLQALQPERRAIFTLQEGLVDQGDPQLLRIVLENLLGNAWKFTQKRPRTEIEFGATQDAGGARTYYVRDNGAGFDMRYHDKLFGVFQRLHAQADFEGNGVGLATVQRIIRRHGGRVWGEGQPERGARFFLTLNESPRPPGTASLPSEN